MITEDSKCGKYIGSVMRGRYRFMIGTRNDGKKKKMGKEGGGGKGGLCNTITPLSVRV